MSFCRWAQVTEELRQALWELEEKEKRRCFEEDTRLRIQEQEDLKNKLGAFTEEKEKAEMLFATTFTPAEEGDGLVEEQHDKKGTALTNGQKENKLLILSVPEAAEASESAEDGFHLSGVGQIQALQVSLIL